MGNSCLRLRRRATGPVMMTDESSPVAIGQNQPLSSAPETWTTQIPMTEGQLRGKRDTFWETAPAYDGRREIWDALKAACEAVEDGDHGLAQAILDGANVSLPTGRLVEVYDELGNRYVVPKYCISRPTNIVGADSSPRGRVESTENEDTDSTTNLLHDTSPSPPGRRTTSGATTTAAGSGPRNRSSSAASGGGKSRKTKSKSSRHSGPPSPSIDIVPIGDPFMVKIRLSTLSKDIKMTLQASDRVKDVKQRLESEQDVPASRITMLYSGRVLSDRTFLKNLDIPRGFLIQAIVT